MPLLTNALNKCKKNYFNKKDYKLNLSTVVFISLKKITLLFENLKLSLKNEIGGQLKFAIKISILFDYLVL